jgi:Fe-S oxidoreductase
MGIDQAILLMNRWARGPLPLSGAVCDGQALWVRLSGERRALAEARAAIALDQAFHSPCSLTHGLRLAGVTESVLSRLGFELTPVADPGLCCGSARTYPILQPALSRPMLRAKVDALEARHPDLIATANIDCYAYLRQEAYPRGSIAAMSRPNPS